jgi:mRNA interferase RelE/StbE
LAWRIELTETAAKALAKLDRQVARRITEFLRETLAGLEDPRSAGKALVGPNALWRYRVGDYRIVVSIEDAAVRVLVIRIGHRREIYR